MIQKLMTRLLIPVLLFTLTACELTTSTDSTKPGPSPTNPNNNQETEEGGISGGGGGMLPADPLHVFEVFQILDDAKSQLRLIINNRRRFKEMEKGGWSKFYFGKENLATQLEKTDLEILADKPCKDKFGNDVDASIHASRPNTICFSAFRVAPKVIKENANKEIMALLIHELSHFLGATEPEAQELQKMATYFMKGITHEYAKNIFNELWDISNSFDSYYSLRDDLSNAVKSRDLAKIQEVLEKWKQQIVSYDLPLKDKDLSLIDYPIAEYESVIRMKLIHAQLYMDTLTETGDQQKMSKEYYEKCFGNHSQLKVKDFSSDNCLFAPLDSALYGDYVISKLNDISELENYLNDVVLYLRDLSNHVRAIAFHYPLPVFNLPTTLKVENPWLKFEGKYKATLLDCSKSPNAQNNWNDGLTEFEVNPRVIKNPFVDLTVAESKEVHSGGWSTSLHYSDDDTRVFGSSSSAVTTIETGNRWYDRQANGWSKKTTSLELVNGESILTKSKEYFSYDYKGLYQAEASCRYQLTPQ